MMHPLGTMNVKMMMAIHTVIAEILEFGRNGLTIPTAGLKEQLKGLSSFNFVFILQVFKAKLVNIQLQLIVTCM